MRAGRGRRQQRATTRTGRPTLDNTPVNGLLGRQVLTTTPLGLTSSSGGLSSRRLWATPKTFDGNEGTLETGSEWAARQTMKKAANPKLGGLHLSLGTQAIGEDKAKRLNPLFVEWLMGWDIGWTDLGSAETESYPSKPLEHSQNYGNEAEA